jgi:hypothetical protein
VIPIRFEVGACDRSGPIGCLLNDLRGKWNQSKKRRQNNSL